jgi:integrase
MAGKRTRGNGEGSIHFREDKQTWVGTIELPPKDGKRRRRYVYAPTKPELLEKLRDDRKRFDVAGDMPTRTMTTGAWLTYWLEHVAAKEVRPITWGSYKSVLVRHVIPEIGTVRLDRLTPSHVRQVHERILATPKSPEHPERGTLSPTSALAAHRVLSSALTAAEREGLIIRNPVGVVRAPRKKPTQLEVLDVPEALSIIRLAFDALERASQGEDYDPYPMRWAVALLTGARRGEVLGLEADRIIGGKQPHIDLSWQLQRLKVGATWPPDYEARPVRGGLWLTRPKSAAGTRIIPLVDPLKTALEAHMAAMRPNQWDLLFAPLGRPIDPHKDSKVLPELLREVGIEKHVRVHDLRHTTVDLLYEAGVPEHIIMEIVGHSVRAVTRGYRSKGNHALLAAGMESLSALLNVPALSA